MTDTTTPATTIDPQDPLPEANWLWRRVLTYALCIAILGIMVGFGWAMFKIVNSVTGKIDAMDARAVSTITLHALDTVETMFRLMFWALMVVVTYYMVAPSAEQITKMMQTAGLLKAGVQFASRTVETPAAREIAATAGQPPQPVVPPAAADSAPKAPTEGVEAPTEGGPGSDEAPDRPTTRDFRPVERDSGPEGSQVAPDPGKPSTGLNPADIVRGV